MRKAVRLRVTLFVRGEEAPAHDFARSAARAVREIIAAGRGAHPELRVSVRRIVEDDSEDAEDVDDDASRDEAANQDSGEARRSERDVRTGGQSDGR